MKYLSLFSGIGGFELGIQQAYENNRTDREYKSNDEDLFPERNQPDSQGSTGDEWQQNPHCIGYSEIDKYAIQTYQKHYPEHKNYGDITKINADELPDFDLLVGGFPCQAFSIAGKRKGFEDTRGTLFFEIARIAKAKQPMFMLLENVKGLISHDGGKTLEVILETLQELGYYVNYEIRNSKDYGVPQNRERIFFTCKHIKLLSNVGRNQRMTTSEQIIQEWLFQLLLNNLAEVKKLQGHASKDSILGYLVLKEIRERLQSQDTGENTLDGILPTDENTFPWKEGEAWQNIGSWLSNLSEEGSNEQRLSTISTVICRTIESKTYTYSTMLESIALATALLRQSQKNLWQEILSSLILIQEGTKYARINNENEEAIITESGTAHIKSELQANGEYFSLGHLRGTRRPEVFPITREGGQDTKPIKRVGGIYDSEKGTHQAGSVFDSSGISATLDTMQGGNRMPYVLEVKQIGTRKDSNSGTQPFQQDRVYDPTGVSPALQQALPEGGHKILVREATKKGYAEATLGDSINLSVPESKTRRGRVGKGVAQTLDTGMQQHTISKTIRAGGRSSPHGSKQNWDSYDTEYGIRRLTPTECERLQGFPDGWTEGVSDTQRYKQCGNAVTVNVIRDIMERLL